MVPVPESHRARRRDRGVFHNAQKLQTKLFFHPSLSSTPCSAGIPASVFRQLYRQLSAGGQS
jgi:hypothetical protein